MLAVDDAVRSLAVRPVGHEVQGQPLADGAREESAYGVLLPAGRLHQVGNRRALRPAEHGEDGILFKNWRINLAGLALGFCYSGFRRLGSQWDLLHYGASTCGFARICRARL